jgi:hypothetical protein
VSGHWRAIIAHFAINFETSVYDPMPEWQDLAVSVGTEPDMSIVAAHAAARLALTYTWSGCRKNLGVFVLRADNSVAAACCFNNGHIVYQSGGDEFGRLTR